MTIKNLNNGDTINPRYEFRTFGKDFSKAIFRMSRLSVPVPEKFRERHSDEIYILSENNDTNNIKIRDRKIDIKTLIEKKYGFEQWKPVIKLNFPITLEILIKQIIPFLNFDLHKAERTHYELVEFLSIIKKHPSLQIVNVKKQRFGYMIENTICEAANVLINGVKVVSICAESTNTDDIKKTIKDLGLEDIENINYVQAIKRVIGVSDKPLAS